MAESVCRGRGIHGDVAAVAAESGGFGFGFGFGIGVGFGCSYICICFLHLLGGYGTEGAWRWREGVQMEEIGDCERRKVAWEDATKMDVLGVSVRLKAEVPVRGTEGDFA